jgi:hypothetical protein
MRITADERRLLVMLENLVEEGTVHQNEDGLWVFSGNISNYESGVKAAQAMLKKIKHKQGDLRFVRPKSTGEVLEMVSCKHLKLHRNKAHAYWYFVYDDGEIYETRTVHIPRLRDMNLQQWKAEANDFLGYVRYTHKNKDDR